MNLIDRWIADQFLRSLEKIRYGQLALTLPDGKVQHFAGSQPGPTCDFVLHDMQVVRNALSRGDVAFAQDYQRGLWDSSDLAQLVTFIMLNEEAVSGYVNGSRMGQLLSSLSYLLNLNTLRGSRRNIQAHYDLGNAFYSLWLDPTMTYSAALYKNASEPLEQAQHNKYDRIIEQLGKPSGSLLEVGCGWGGFADRALQKGDFGIKGITLSNEQHAHANQKLQGQANIVLEDYRHQTGKYDHIVSIEMFEAVGERYWPTYFNKIGSLLKQGGKAVIQTITIEEKRFETYRRSSDMIRSFIFPGGMLPSTDRFSFAAARAGLKTSNEFHFGQHYADTLQQWLVNFDTKHDDVRALGFDNRFIRLWRFYLAACIAGFRTGRTSVMQVDLSHA